MKKIKQVSLFLCLLFFIFISWTSQTRAANSEIHFEEYNIVLFPSQGKLEIREVITFDGLGETYYGQGELNEDGREIVMILPIPEEAVDLKVLYGLDVNEYALTDKGLELYTPIPASGYRLSMSYFLPDKGGANYSFTVQTKFFTRELFLYTPKDLEVEAEDLVFSGILKMSDKISFNHYYGENLSAGSRRQVTVKAPAQGTERITRGYNPSFHNASHLRVWNKSPFRRMEPHAFVAVIFIIPLILLGLYLKKIWQMKNEERFTSIIDQEDKVFLQLRMKLTVYQKKLKELKSQYIRGEISETYHQQAEQIIQKKIEEIKNKLSVYVD